MKGSRVFPRATSILRSVMVAGAGTVIWMALSATAASADSGSPDKGSLLGGVTSSVGATTGAVTNAVGSLTNAVAPQNAAPTLSIPVPNVPLPAPVKAVIPATPVEVQVPAVTPVVQDVGAAADAVIAAVPVVSSVVPGNTVGSAVDTVAVPVAGVVDHAVEVVVPPVNDALEPVGLQPVTDVTNPVVQTIIDAVDSVVPPVGSASPPADPGVPPVTGPPASLPSQPGGDSSLPPAEPGLATGPASGVVNSLDHPVHVLDHSAAPEPAVLQLFSAPRDTDTSPLRLITSVLGPAGYAAGAGVSADVHPESPTEMPAGPDSVPAGLTGAGSGGSNNGPQSPAAAFLQGALIIPADLLTGLATVSDDHLPEPVSFDPGSSPD